MLRSGLWCIYYALSPAAIASDAPAPQLPALRTNMVAVGPCRPITRLSEPHPKTPPDAPYPRRNLLRNSNLTFPSTSRTAFKRSRMRNSPSPPRFHTLPRRRHFNGTSSTDDMDGTDGSGASARAQLALARARETRRRIDAALSCDPATPGAHDEQPRVREDSTNGTGDTDGTDAVIARAELAIARARQARAQRAALALEHARLARDANVAGSGDCEPEWFTEAETVLHGCGTSQARCSHAAGDAPAASFGADSAAPASFADAAAPASVADPAAPIGGAYIAMPSDDVNLTAPSSGTDTAAPFSAPLPEAPVSGADSASPLSAAQSAAMAALPATQPDHLATTPRRAPTCTRSSSWWRARWHVRIGARRGRAMRRRRRACGSRAADAASVWRWRAPTPASASAVPSSSACRGQCSTMGRAARLGGDGGGHQWHGGARGGRPARALRAPGDGARQRRLSRPRAARGATASHGAPWDPGGGGSPTMVPRPGYRLA